MKRSDSTTTETQIFQEAYKGIPVPACTPLYDYELPFWRAVTQTRASWSEVDLIHAANLARTMHAIEKNQALLLKEGDVIMNQRGTPVMNPRFTVLETLSRRSVAISTKIHVHAVATLGEAKLGKGKNAKKQQALNALNNEQDEDELLLARPN